MSEPARDPRDEWIRVVNEYSHRISELRNSRVFGLLTAVSILQFANASLIIGLTAAGLRTPRWVPGVLIPISMILLFVALLLLLVALVPSIASRFRGNIHPLDISKLSQEKFSAEVESATPLKLRQDLTLETWQVAKVLAFRDKWIQLSLLPALAGVAILVLSLTVVVLAFIG